MGPTGMHMDPNGMHMGPTGMRIHETGKYYTVTYIKLVHQFM